MPDITFEQFEDLLDCARETCLESLAANEREGGEPYSSNDVLKMFIERVVDDLGTGNWKTN